MIPRHPFEWLPISVQKRAFVALLVVTLVVMVGLSAVGSPLNTEVSPYGIVSFELAGELSLAQAMAESWGPGGPVYAALSLGLDYLFLIAYASCIALGCVLVTGPLAERVEFLSLVGVLLAWAQFGAALLYAIENYALFRVLLGTEQELWPVVARWCAVPKFLIIGIGVVYVFTGIIAVRVARTRAQ